MCVTDLFGGMPTVNKQQTTTHQKRNGSTKGEGGGERKIGMNGDRTNDVVWVQAQVVLSFALVNLSMRLVFK